MHDDEYELFGEANEADEAAEANTSEVSEEEVAKQQAAEGEQMYRHGPPALKKRGRGRPTLDEVKRRKVRERVQRFRAKQIHGIKKTWSQNLAALPELERNALLAQQKEVAVLSALIADAIAGMNLPSDYLPDLFLEVQQFTSRPGCSLVDSWTTDLSAETMTADEWSRFDDETYKRFGLRTRIWKLQYREFLRWISTATVEPELASAAAGLLAPMDPPNEPKYIAEPIVFVSEADREQRAREREIADESVAREVANFVKWQARQLGSRFPEEQ